jgi:ABC-type lipoprotein release transport system permease subunit
MRLRDLLSEALAGLLQRPAQAAVTIIGTAVGIGTLIATVGIARTAGNQIVTEVGALAPTDIRVDIKESADPTIDVAVGWEAVAAVRSITGVAESGAMAEVTGAPRVRMAPVASYDAMAADVRVVAASSGLLRAVGATLLAGRDFDQGHAARADAVALVGSAAASRMGLRAGSSEEAIFLDDMPLVVMGVFDTTSTAPELSTAVLVPWGLAASQFGVAGPSRLYVSAEPGATEVVSRQIGLALFPRDPDAISVVHGPLPTRLRGRVAGEVNILFLLLGSLSLLVACFGIASTALVTVMERTTEIGLRRALGISARDIGVMYLLEAGMSGAVGGLVGASGGLVVTVSVSAARDWTPVLDPWLAPAAVVLGVLVGLVAGSIAAVKAMRMEPIAALHGARGTE